MIARALLVAVLLAFIIVNLCIALFGKDESYE